MTRLVRNARAYLLSLPGVSEQTLDAHLQNWQCRRQESIPDLYRTLLHHAKNRQGMPNSIGDVGRLQDIFFGFDPTQIAERYQTHADILHQIGAQGVRTAGALNPDNHRSH